MKQASDVTTSYVRYIELKDVVLHNADKALHNIIRARGFESEPASKDSHDCGCKFGTCLGKVKEITRWQTITKVNCDAFADFEREKVNPLEWDREVIGSAFPPTWEFGELRGLGGATKSAGAIKAVGAMEAACTIKTETATEF